MFHKNKPKNPPKSHSVPEHTGVYKRPTAAEEDRTETLEILLGDIELALENDSESRSDPRHNTEGPTVDRQRSK
jgi:hypothetical protein